MSIFDNETIELDCECGRKIKKTIGRLKHHKNITCTCGARLLIDTKKITAAQRDIEKSLDNLTKNITINF